MDEKDENDFTVNGFGENDDAPDKTDEKIISIESEKRQARGAYGMIASSLLAPVLFICGPMVLVFIVFWLIKKIFGFVYS